MLSAAEQVGSQGFGDAVQLEVEAAELFVSPHTCEAPPVSPLLDAAQTPLPHRSVVGRPSVAAGIWCRLQRRQPGSAGRLLELVEQGEVVEAPERPVQVAAPP